MGGYIEDKETITQLGQVVISIRAYLRELCGIPQKTLLCKMRVLRKANSHANLVALLCCHMEVKSM